MIIRRRRWIVLISVVAICTAIGIGALAIFLGAFERSVVSVAVNRALTPVEIAALAPRGRYLAAAADCAACHTVEGGAPWAGGLPFKMPMGTLYATNISPDPDTGIGKWTRAQFHRALRDGIARGGRHLYPAMPYVSYRQLTEGDVDAIYAYLLTRQPMHVANRTDSFPFAYVRQSLTFWNLFNLPSKVFVNQPARPAAWNHGRYLVDALGHCGECHTPRDITMGMIPSKYLKGTVLEGVDAPDITPAGLAALGFDAHGLGAYMRTGMGPQGVMSFAMYEVVRHSTQYLTPADTADMAGYLSGSAQPSPPPSILPASLLPGGAIAGRQTYVQVCASCHGLQGEGIPNVAPPMATNAALRLPTARNLLVAIDEGLPEHAFPNGARMQAMPGFRDLLSDQETVALANYLRVTWGGGRPDVDAKFAAGIRAANP